MKSKCVITKTTRGEVLIDLTPGHALNKSRAEIVKKLEDSVYNKRLAGYDSQWLKNGRIVLYYNAIVDREGNVAFNVAREIAEIYESND